MNENARVRGMESLDDLEQYYNKLLEMANSGEPSGIMNPDRLHNAVAMRAIFETAKKSVSMYCGEFSLFRKNFGDILRGELGSIEKTERDKMIACLVGRLNDSLKTFLEEKGSRLEVIIENYDFKLEDEPVYEVLKPYIKCGRVMFYELSNDSNQTKYIDHIGHFTFADCEMYRREQDQKEHKAYVCFNNKEWTMKLAYRYEFLKEFVFPIQFTA